MKVKYMISDGDRVRELVKKQPTLSVPWWLSGLRIWHCHCYGSSCCCGAGSIPGQGIYAYQGHTAKKKKKKKKATLKEKLRHIEPYPSDIKKGIPDRIMETFVEIKSNIVGKYMEMERNADCINQ